MSLKLVIQKEVPNMLVHWIDDSEIWASSNYTLYRSNDEGITYGKFVDLNVSSLMRLLGKSRLIARGLRLGVRDLRRLKSGTILVIADRKIFRSKNGRFQAVHFFQNGLGPLREGWCEDDSGNCYLGEYFLNDKRDTPVHLLKSADDGQTWKTIHSFQRIRHIHCVQYDPFLRRIWMGTGDRDDECSISFSEDEGKTWTEIGSGDQMFRAVSLLFTENYVYWGSDSPTIQNYIYRYARKAKEIERMVAVDGPVDYSTRLGNGIMLFATAAVGNSEGKSVEWDQKAHIWASKNGTRWEDLISWRKDIYPYILGFGRVCFAHGHYGDKLCFTAQSLRKVDNTLFCAELYVGC
jgi:hypothetical protein